MSDYKKTIIVNSYLDVPKMHQTGFFKRRIPIDIYNSILDLYKLYKQYIPLKKESNSEPRASWAFTKFLNLAERAPQLSKNLNRDLLNYINNEMKIEFVNSQLYGFRIYLDKSRIKMHRDRPDLHVGAILQIDQWGSEWPLDIEDHNGVKHEVVLSPGEMIVYESSRISHGRLKEFEGVYYTNLLFHASLPNVKVSDEAAGISLLDRKYHP